MQFIAECYDLLRNVGGLGNDAIGAGGGALHSRVSDWFHGLYWLSVIN